MKKTMTKEELNRMFDCVLEAYGLNDFDMSDESMIVDEIRPHINDEKVKGMLEKTIHDLRSIICMANGLLEEARGHGVTQEEFREMLGTANLFRDNHLERNQDGGRS